MSMTTAAGEIVYPDSDGEPMAENTLQFEWIVTLKEGLDALFRRDPNVFVAGDLLWYPVEGRPDLRAAPDAMVAFGRPKGYRGSYRQWEEGNVAPQVVFEVLSPGNRAGEMARKLAFYDRHGVEEYYVYDPDRVTLAGYVRDTAGALAELPVVNGHVSPRLGVRFELADELVVRTPDGGRLRTYLEVFEAGEAARGRADALQSEAERERADAERERANAQQATAALDALRAKLRAAGIDPDAV